MQMNDFNEKTRELFSGLYKCFWCGSNKPDCLHHIVGRGTKEDDCESSPLNASLLCNQKCHIANHNLLLTEKHKRIMLDKTYQFITSSGYTFTDKDERFIEKYVKYYY